MCVGGENKPGSSASSLLHGKTRTRKNWSCILRNLKTKGKSFLCIDLEKTSNVKKENKKVNVNESVKLRKKCRILHPGEKVVFRK